jgi:hypothetical protein
LLIANPANRVHKGRDKWIRKSLMKGRMLSLEKAVSQMTKKYKTF